MAVIIKKKQGPQPAPEAIEALPREGVHLRATPWERQTAHGYKGGSSGALCNTPAAKLDYTFMARAVTCPRCLAYMADRLRLPEYLTLQQWAILGRDPMPGAPDADKGEAYPTPLPPRNAYGRAGVRTKQAGSPRPRAQEPAQEATSDRPAGKAHPKQGRTQKAAQSLYDDF